MLERTKKHHTESIRFYGSPDAIKRLRECAVSAGAVEMPVDSIPAEEVFPDLATNSVGIYLKGSRYREELTQVQLAEITGIPRRHISEMESGKRTIGKESAKKLAEALGIDYRMLL
ncbi:MAG: helix-turn-helix transcriptional regulator [Desulfuromonadales bacterium]|nr:helix-turn-helix transcriptional regulator [Desulfuromonadales bacterium]